MKFLRSFLAFILAFGSIAPALAFTDVSADDWFNSYITELAAQGVVGGNPDGTFAPNAQISRAEIAKIAVNIAKHSGVITSDSLKDAPSFKDVLKGAWYEESVLLGAKNGIFSGYKDSAGNPTGYFKPENKVTRAEAIKILLGAAAVRTKSEPAETFSDVDADAWFAPYVTTAFNWNIVDGYRNTAGKLTGKFGPFDPVTRAQAAKIGVLVQDPQ